MPDLLLSGCAPVPLAHYLKALGILRIVSEQKYPTAKGRWNRDHFVLSSNLDREGLLKFFLEEYRPTPVMAPWNGGSGFHPKDNVKALEAIKQSAVERLQPYAAAISAAKNVLCSMSLGEKPTPEQKATLLLLCRNTLPEGALQWLDAAYVLTEDGAKYPPLLGTGGNDGRLEFTNNFMQRIAEVIDVATGKPLAHSTQRLTSALFAEAIATPLAKAPVGQFLPGTAGGANATAGFDAPSAVNPWDFILMMEGALLFASASVKRLESSESGALAYPFCVRQAGVGYASAASSDESASRAEMWLPVWTQRAVTLAEISAIFSEGRAQVGNRAARNGVDFARAVVSLGVDRGLDEFQRYGFQVRNGLSYFATPLTRIAARKNAAVDLLSDIDAWLDRFRRAATKDTAPASARRSLSVLESRIVDLCVNNTPERHMQVFIALGQCEATAARSLKWAKENFLQPLYGLRKAWLRSDLWNDPKYGTEFRLAASLASITGKFGDEWLPLRCHLETVDSYVAKDTGALSFRWADVVTNNVQWSKAGLVNVLNNVFARRLLLGEEAPQTRFEVCPASLDDIKACIEGVIDDTLLTELLWSMSLINWREKAALPSRRGNRVVPPTLYALLRLCFPPVQKTQPEGIFQIPAIPAIHLLASQGKGSQAATLAIRRLRGSGYHPVLKQISAQGDYVRRTAAALLFPVSSLSLEEIHTQTIRPVKEAETVTA